ncbi:two-component system response regulator CreB [Amphritea atlantica]|uniref:Two-component system response regulator CreB n=1 Tax=Amphritea atlantica TaxID=355243 RepID=A0ABY5H199_9GAMM|nr:two-component system response regulator CreB [Amphritea atlantica]
MMIKTILIVEDEAEIADALIYVLKAEGMDPIWVSTAQNALIELNATAVDLAILDVGLPDGNGFDLFKTIRESYLIPMMFLTARSEEIDRIIGLEIGADDYVTKPFSPREVAARVKNILKRAAMQPNTDTHLTKNGFNLDSQQMKITYQGQMLELTRSEYSLLETLINHPQQIFSRRQLIEAVWSSQHPSDERVIDTHIKSLRHKLKNIDAVDVPIMTHRGFGYSLAATS